MNSLYRDIIITYDLTPDQVTVLDNLCTRLEDYPELNSLLLLKYYMSPEFDLVIYRNFGNRIVELIIHPDDDIALCDQRFQKGYDLKFFDIDDINYDNIIEMLYNL